MSVLIPGKVLDFLYDVTTGGSSPNTTYNDWCTELSLPNTGVYSGAPTFNIDDSPVPFTPATGLVSGAHANIYFGPETGIAWTTLATAPGGTMGNSGAVGMNRYFGVSNTTMGLWWHSDSIGDVESKNVRAQKSASVTIMYGENDILGAGTTGAATWALRLNADGTMVLVIAPTNDTYNLRVLNFTSPISSLAHSFAVDSIASGVTKKFTISYAAPTYVPTTVAIPVMNRVALYDVPPMNLAYNFALGKAPLVTPNNFELKRLLDVVSIKDFIYGGAYRITGSIMIQASPTDLPMSAKVRLYKKNDGNLVKEVFSAADGSYIFNNIANTSYYLIAFDHTGSYNAVIRDSILPDLIP